MACDRCGTQYSDPQPSDERLAEIYSPEYYAPWSAERADVVDNIKRATFRPLLDACDLETGARLLELGCGTGSLLASAKARGAEPYGIDLNEEAIRQTQALVPDACLHVGRASDRPFGDTRFDAVVMVDFLEHARAPENELVIAAELLKPQGRVVISTPRADSLTRRILGPRWPQYREEHLSYFSRDGIELLLDRCGLHVVKVERTRKVLTLAYAYGQAKAYPVTVITPATTAAYRVLPWVRHQPVRLSLGEMTVVAAHKHSEGNA